MKVYRQAFIKGRESIGFMLINAFLVTSVGKFKVVNSITNIDKNIILCLHILGNCSPDVVPGRIECGWPDITKEQCLARDCCYDNNGFNNGFKCFVKPHLGE